MPAATRRSKAGLKGKRPVRDSRNRILIEFPEALLQRADEAARALDKNRSELIRDAVVEKLDALEMRRFEAELAAAYAANAERNLALAEEFSHVDAEGL